MLMPTNQMIRVHTPGGPDRLQLETVAMAPLEAGEILVEIEAAGVNFLDTQMRKGVRPQPLPLAMGGEGAGTVAQVGSGVQDVRVGDRVAWPQSPGSYARWKVIAESRVFVLPDGVSCEAAAATLFQGVTAHYLACSTHPLAAGETCVVHSAAGGVGLLLTQIARLRGAAVIGAVSTLEKAAVAKANGAIQVAIYGEGDLVEIAKAATGGRGVDVVYDAVGKETFEQSLGCLRPRGLLALYGESSGAIPPMNVSRLLTAGSVYLTRTGLSFYTATTVEYRRRGDDILNWLAQGLLTPRIDSIHALEDAADAHRALESRETIGKVLLSPSRSQSAAAQRDQTEPRLSDLQRFAECR